MVNVIGTGLLFTTHVVIARTMGSSSYGHFAYAMTWLNILVLFAKMGLDTASIRFVAEYNGTEKWELMKGFVRRANQLSLVASLIVSLSTAVVIWLIREKLEPELATTFWIVCLILPLQSLFRIRVAGLRGLKKVIKSQSAFLIVRPAILLIAVVCTFFVSRNLLNATTVMAMNLAAFAGSLLLVAVYFKKAFPRNASEAKPDYMMSRWIRVALPMLFIHAMLQTHNQTDVLVIGFFLDSSSVGKYFAAKRITALVRFGLTAVNLIAAPLISELWHQGRKQELQRMLRLAAWGIFAFTLPVSLAVIVFGKQVLSFFGPDFSSAYWALVILTAGRIVFSLAGSLELIMHMTGHQNMSGVIVAVSVLVNISLGIVLIPAIGINGAAISMSVSLIVLNVLMFTYVLKKMKLNPTILRLGN